MGWVHGSLVSGEFLRVDDLVIDRVAKRFGKRAENDFECLATIVPFEVLNVLQNERCGTVEIEDVSNREEEVALLNVFESVLATEAELLRYACDAEWLAGESSAKNVMRGNVGYGDAMNVTVGPLAKIRFVRLLAELIVVGGKHAATTCALEGNAKTANATKEVYETQLIFSSDPICVIRW